MTSDFEIVDPRADALIESLRSVGYTLETAVADLIDNSISAHARTIGVEFRWDGERSIICISDDGDGMAPDELRDAMRAGSRHPTEERSPDDLGRFGLGLKTASLSQCRSLTVGSKRVGHPIAIRRWDLDVINEYREWRLLSTCSDDAALIIESLDPLQSGTVVVWEHLDRVVEAGTAVDSRLGQRHFNERIAQIEQHLAMVFHRFMSGRGRIRITINGRDVVPWDPFLADHAATQQLKDEAIALFGNRINVQPFVLPHHSKLGNDHESAGGPKGWNAQQGFYIYRQRRMLVAGDWLGFFRQEEHYKLARILVDIPNSLDSEWDIDVRKARARPPDSIREDLRRIAVATRERAVAVYRGRGMRVSLPGVTHTTPWTGSVRDGIVNYRVNRDHPLVAAILAGAEEQKREISALLRLIEETVPVQQIYIDASEHPSGHTTPFSGSSDRDVLSVMEAVVAAMLGRGFTLDEAFGHLASMEPFDAMDELRQDLLARFRRRAAHG